ncbi:sensor histidine kinase [Phenylobacterium sp. 58.2.17]|uniref:sensor histidine kinase n=1 Tax=Phenylobacterium sp. 58.2.17 TaxID=2969306 RepID=UPI002263F41D|nr:PAS domain-containing sensor histidine kinase [Phenylobacterium sp. 58.2.17]MCX7585312.1 PAS domain-containing protein [Phenylobacterium sp. 58.2.17]
MLDRFAALDLSPNWYSVLSADLTLVWVNKALAEGFGHARSDLISKGLFEAFPRARGVLEVEGDEAVRRSVDTVFRTGQPDRIALHYHAGSMEEALDDGDIFTICHSPIFDETGAVHLVLAHLSNATEFARLLAPGSSPPLRLGDVPQVASRILSGALDLVDTNRALYEDRDRLRQMFDQAPGFIALLTGVDHVFELVNGAYHRLVGDRPLIGLPAREAVPEIYQVFGSALERAFATGEAFVGHGLTMIVDNGFSEPTEKAVDFVFQPLTNAAGEVFGIFLEGADVTERTRAEQTQRLLMRELQHRIKNTLATVRAIAARSARTTPDPQLFIRAFEDRLIALAASHELLTQGGWKGADVLDLIERELRPYDVSRLRLAGDRRQVPPQAAVPLSLAIHELATNAAKYGALSADSGRVDVEWWTEEKLGQPRLRVQWRESGGPPVVGPSRRGFGTELLDGMMRRGADPVLDFARTGLRCTFELPLGHLAPTHSQGGSTPNAHV